MSAGAATDKYHHMQLRIPGWLLLLVLLGLGAWWTSNQYSRAFGDDNNRGLNFPARVTRLESSFENQVLTVTVLVESNRTFEPRSLAFTITLDDRSQLAASGHELGPGAWHGRSYVFAVDRLIPEGRRPAFLVVTGANGSSVVALAEENPQ